MVDLIVVAVFSIIAGAVVGLVPGLTPLLGLILVMPWLANYSVTEIITFWVCFLSVSQYYGSVGALLLKVPGETSSLPVLVSSKDLKLAKSISRAYTLTAFSSYVASLVGIAILAFLIYALHDSWYALFSLKFTIFFLTVTFVLLLLARKQYLLNAVLLFAGLFVAWFPDSAAAVQLCSSTHWACFTLDPADFNLVIISLYVIPYLLESPGHFFQRKPSTAVNSWASILKYRVLAVKHALLGFIVGFTPGMGVTLSSNLSANIEVAKNKYHKLSAMAAAEAANNSSSISCLVPFLFIGLPITGTELFLDNWLRVFKAFDVNYELLYRTVELTSALSVPFYNILIAALLVTCSACFLLTSRFIKFYQLLGKVPPKIFDVCIKGIIIAVTAYSFKEAISAGWIVPMATLIIFSLVGIWAHRRKFDVIALPVAIVIGKFAIDKFVTAYNLWS